MYGYKQCRECGSAVRKSEMDEHVCDPIRRENHQVMIAKRDLERIEDDLAAWLATPAGAFQRFLAARGM